MYNRCQLLRREVRQPSVGPKQTIHGCGLVCQVAQLPRGESLTDSVAKFFLFIFTRHHRQMHVLNNRSKIIENC